MSEDKREYERIDTTEKRNSTIELSIEGKAYNFTLSDLSQGGLAFLVKELSADFFQLGKIVYISRVGTKNYFDFLEAEVMHVSSEGKLKKVGVQFTKVPE